ncbi:MAG: 5-methyltetrahydropteroyltriglutamate--homocysteine methyltransferase [Parasphingorhabdus sp.]|jgi:5-methyltetrahydropteroyltriglutamate--homocysteine methyltransferase
MTMPITTTCIGAYPKPDYISTGNWAEASPGQQDGESREFTYTNDYASDVPEELLVKATLEAVKDQTACGIDIPTDGEQRRENYIHYHCRHLHGMDFDNLTEKVHRNGAAVAPLPTIRSKVKPDGSHFLYHDYSSAQAATDQPLKMTVPGPLTIIDTTANIHYESEKALARDLADALNFEIRHLADTGCTYIHR